MTITAESLEARARRALNAPTTEKVAAGERAAEKKESESSEIAPPLRVLEVGDLSAVTLSPVRFVVEPIIPRGVVTLLGGHGGTGKSTLALTFAAHVACGTRWNGLHCTTGCVLFVSLEDSVEIVRWRLRAICAAYGLDMEAVAQGILIADGTDAHSAALARELRIEGTSVVAETPALLQLTELAAGVSLIVIDNASDAFDANENDRRQGRSFVRMLASVARTVSAGMLLLAHIDKHAAKYGAAGNTFSGSTAWHNSARSRLALIESSGVLELVHEKRNYTVQAAFTRLRFNDRGVLVPAGDTSAGTVTPTDAADADAVLAALHAAEKAGSSVPPGRTGPSTAHTVLATFDLPEALRGPRGRSRFWRALNSLLADGRAKYTEYKTVDRKMRQRIIPTAAPNVRARQSPKPPSALGAQGCANALIAPNEE
jgi:KaiC/GvpD/RAD55 family RecA-like ATPase